MQQYYIKVPILDTPQALKIVEAHGLTIKMMYASRHYMRTKEKHPTAKEFLEASGVYILFNKSDDLSTPIVYIGQSDQLGNRIHNHDANKDFWEEILVFTNSSSQQFSITHIKTIEAYLYNLAKQHNRCKLVNTQHPKIPTSAANLDTLIRNDVKQIISLVHILGYDFFEPHRTQPQEVNRPSSPNGNISSPASLSENEFVFQGQVRSQFIHAQALYLHGAMVVLKNSKCTIDTSPDCPESIKRLRHDLEERNVIVLSPNGKEKLFAQDYSFDSASAASGVVSGRSSNGKTDWKTASGMTLKDWINNS